MTGFDRLHVSGSDRSKHIKCAPTGHPALALGGQPREECAPSDQARKDTRGADLSPRLRRARGSPAEISRAAVAPWACGELVLLVNHGVASAGLTTDGVCQFCSAEPKGSHFQNISPLTIRFHSSRIDLRIHVFLLQMLFNHPGYQAWF